ncbi:26S proteasome non-ATPase regulatory subunit 5 domain-containing protein [Rozella allomycis CSF55]|uniref:26S proteasome non-ATPase regulatory subunit 5 domain-containing protein n=1 Tax=Rozella allomycis (strain CSF55) TaxID=988480 RepID=A0A075AXI5_ROZAC|nr:26S proteasome non-ATPase regulatory subunit 5 domain-containing protein [Rozella allomycis CSF55]|eukprot:EPZ34859.1 26S proteasome non-ATPase regulatory subunit 5 domain-containing protein [Rozella allomycis CSF55]
MHYPSKEEIQALSFVEIYTQQKELLYTALNDFQSDIRYEALKCCFKLFDDAAGINYVDEEFVLNLISHIKDEDWGDKVVSFLAKLGSLRDQIIYFRIMDLFGQLSCVNPEWGNSLGLLQTFPEKIMKEDLLTQMNAIELCNQCADLIVQNNAWSAIGSICSDIETAVIIQGKDMISRLITECIHSVAEKRSACLLSLENIFNCRGLISSGSEFCRALYYEIGCETSALSFLLSIATNPDDDIRIPAFKVLFSLCHFDWAVTDMVNKNNYFEYLLNRDRDTTKTGTIWKYDIIKKLSEHPMAASLFSPGRLFHLKTYVQQGAYFLPKDLLVSTETS